MQVVFDHQIFLLQKVGGISRYFFELAKELNKIKDCSAEIIAPFHQNLYLEDVPFVKSFGPIKRKLFSNRFYDRELKTNESVLKTALHANNKAILHETYYTHRTKASAPRVITIHDMIYELFNKGTEEENMVIASKKTAVMEADLVIAVSENTKRDLLKFYPEAAKKTHVVYHGVEQAVPRNSKAQRPFILHVGNRGWYKNFDLLLKIFTEDTRFHAWDLICFGGGAASEAEMKKINKTKYPEKIKFMDGPDEKLRNLYRSASALVYISSYEGFGMPVLEAMNYGCPVLCANSSSLPEVAGEAALMTDPSNEAETKEALHRILTEKTLRDNLINAGLERVKLFTWKKCAAETHALYKKLLT